MINWNDFEKALVKLEKDQEKVLVLGDWKNDNRFQRPGLRLHVFEEDNKSVDKELMTTSTRLIKKLKPIVEKAESRGLERIKVGITKIGDGFETNFIVKEC